MKLAPERDPLPRLLAFPLLAAAASAGLVFWRAQPLLSARLDCPLRRLTGLPCPTCGGTHAAQALAGLDLAGAWSANPLVVAAVLALPLWAALAAVLTARPRWRRRVVLSPREQRLLRSAAWAALLGNWLYLIIRHD